MNEEIIPVDQIEWVGDLTAEQMKELKNEIERMRARQVECVVENEKQETTGYGIQRFES